MSKDKREAVDMMLRVGAVSTFDHLIERIERLREWIKTREAYTAHEGVYEWEAHVKAREALEDGDL